MEGEPIAQAKRAIEACLAVLSETDLFGIARREEFQARLLALAQTATTLAAPSAWKRGLDVWGREPDGFDYMRSLRQEFDPRRTLNPGRFAGFL